MKLTANIEPINEVKINDIDTNISFLVTGS